MAFDVVVIGQGAMGSAALYHLARKGVRALGIERFEIGHERGSSHGRTRVIRLGYFEHPSYVPLVHRAFVLWRDLEAASERSLLNVTGIAEIGRPESALVTGTLASCRLHDLPHTLLDAGELMRRYPAFVLPRDFVGVIQPDGGYLEAEPAIRAHLDLALSAGAQLRTGERVRAIEPTSGGVRVTTDRGTIDAGAAIVAAGPWATTLLPDLRLPLQVTRQVLIWVRPHDESLLAPGRFPVFMIESGHGIHYGFPVHGADGMKLARHFPTGEIVDPETYDRSVSAQDEAVIRNPVVQYLPAADGPLLAAKTCLYTMTPDGDFLIDHVPGHKQIIVASPCSGHGFKFAPVVGEILASLATTGATEHDIARFRLARLT